ncbi:hemerythrin family protein [Helicobacter sp.]|uniref:bacteriohemerythrin n=1 Tax=Helicobacter sp. TaxID=218 RepID=UPI002587335B|nr:hemerythrin family protein [Helicobacter sp.]MCI7047668.1 hemerythrin family protein [Helicobacter sp.]
MLEWSEEFSVKNQLLDDQHKYLFQCLAIANRLANSPIENKEKLLLALINRFLEYTVTHFKDEEAYMDRVCFPFAEQHKRLHKGLINILQNFKIDSKDIQKSCEKFYGFSKNWLVNHILNEDKRLEAYHNHLIDAGEIPYSLEQQTKIIALSQNIHRIEEQKHHNYICLCHTKVFEVCDSLHEMMQTKRTFLRCKVCKQPLVLIDERLQEEQYYEMLIKKYFQ